MLPAAMLTGLSSALVLVQLRGMAQDLSWDNAAKQYEDVCVAAKYQW
jgi:hypothetical protein